MSSASVPWEVLRDAAEGAIEVFLAAPYIKLDTLGWVLSLINGSARLTCVTRWRRGDVASGVSDRGCRQLALEHGGDFRLHQSLHAKYYRFGEFVLIGSANLSGAGMGYSQWPNLELLCEPGGRFDWRSFESRLMSESYTLGDSEYRLWLDIEVTGRRVFGSVGGAVVEESESVGWEPRTREPEHLWLAYGGFEQHIPGNDERRSALADLAELALPVDLGREGFDNWMVGALLESAWVGRVRSLWGRDRMEVRAILEEEWGVDPSAVERARQTLESWIQRYLP